MNEKLRMYVRSIILGNTILDTIDLSNQGLTNKDIALLFRALETNKCISQKITTIIFSHNNITVLPRPPKLPSLKRLYIDYNELQAPPDISALTALELINFRNNKLKTPPILTTLIELRCVYLQNNPLLIAADVYHNKKLEQLHLDNVPLTAIDCLVLQDFVKSGCVVIVYNNLSIADIPKIAISEETLALHVDRLKEALSKTSASMSFLYTLFALNNLTLNLDVTIHMLRFFSDTPLGFLMSSIRRLQELESEDDSINRAVCTYLYSSRFQSQKKLFDDALVKTTRNFFNRLQSPLADKPEQSSLANKLTI